MILKHGIKQSKIQMNKLHFLIEEFPVILRAIPETEEAKFGKMNLHQMIEHMAWSVKIANGEIEFPCKLAPEVVSKMHSFMMGDKPFKENTPNSNLPTEPVPVLTDTVNTAIDQLQSELVFFKERYENEEGLQIVNPFFGTLNFKEQIQLLHKHALHHLRQFGVRV